MQSRISQVRQPDQATSSDLRQKTHPVGTRIPKPRKSFFLKSAGENPGDATEYSGGGVFVLC